MGPSANFLMIATPSPPKNNYFSFSSTRISRFGRSLPEAFPHPLHPQHHGAPQSCLRLYSLRCPTTTSCQLSCNTDSWLLSSLHAGMCTYSPFWWLIPSAFPMTSQMFPYTSHITCTDIFHHLPLWHCENTEWKKREDRDQQEAKADITPKEIHE